VIIVLPNIYMSHKIGVNDVQITEKDGSRYLVPKGW